MMNILAIETSASLGTIALRHNNHNFQVNLPVQQQQIPTILELIEALLQRCQLQLSDLDYLAFAAGPGSFTGIRIAFGIVQGMALASNKLVLAISSLQVLAQTSWRLLQQSHVIPAINAYMEQIYWGCYALDQQGVMQPLQADQVSVPETLSIKHDTVFSGVGNAWSVYAERLPQVVPVCNAEITPQAYDLLTLAQFAIQNGDAKIIDNIAPYYLRDKEAWRKIAAK